MRNDCCIYTGLATAWFCVWLLGGLTAVGIPSLVAMGIGNAKDGKGVNDPIEPNDYAAKYAGNTAIVSSIVYIAATIVFALGVLLYYRCKGNSTSAGEQQPLTSSNSQIQATPSEHVEESCCSKFFSNTGKCLEYLATKKEPDVDEVLLDELHNKL